MTHAFTLDHAHAIVLAHPFANESDGQLSNLVISETTISFTWAEIFNYRISYTINPATGTIIETVDDEIEGDHENFADVLAALAHLFADQ